MRLIREDIAPRVTTLAKHSSQRTRANAYLAERKGWTTEADYSRSNGNGHNDFRFKKPFIAHAGNGKIRELSESAGMLPCRRRRVQRPRFVRPCQAIREC